MIIVFSLTFFDFLKRAESCLKSKSSEKYSAVTELVPVDITLQKFENAYLFLRLCLPAILIRHENEVFWKRYLKLDKINLKMSALGFSENGERYENRAFRKRWPHFPFPYFIQMTVDYVLRFQTSQA